MDISWIPARVQGRSGEGGVLRVVVLQWSYRSRRSLSALSEGLGMLDFTHSRGRSRTIATTTESMASKRSRVRLPSAPLHHSLGLTET